ncbi:hypothetical protein K439DRAFT_1631524 [Ramaria rubella]|nr:hypothetical protein K439DRAFT_1631524 [Ramaria rubella]
MSNISNIERILSNIFDLLSLLSLSALTLTVFLSNTLHRHPVSINLILISLLGAASSCYDDLAYLAFPASLVSGNNVYLYFHQVQYYALSIMMLVAMLNLVIHLWLTMRAAFYKGSGTGRITTFAVSELSLYTSLGDEIEEPNL